ncbi:hypothetical protein [Streptomyces pseudovenezuelae]|uniref:hypothetical protein n=1 Tax=Streptomyces pseudovenezuelae TaxID=67350 RepID=UPI0036E31DB2
MIRTEHLADYLINNDFELELERRDYLAIFERFIDDHPDPDGELISDEQLKEAMELALEDPVIQFQIARNK